MRRAKAVPLLLALACASTPTLGWGWCAHRIVGEIAERRLDPATREEISRMLGGRSLADVADWADRVRETERYGWTRRLHYVNVAEGASRFDAQRDCPAGDCVVAGIRRFADELSGAQTARKRKVTALKFLVHLVGDVHQPLHAARQSDLGGNLITVVHRDRRQTLHQLWDAGLLDCTAVAWKRRAAEIDRALTEGRLAAWSGAEPEDWAWESWLLAHSHAYPVPASGEIDEAYLARNAALVEARLAAAGVRLADLLQRSLSAGPD